MHTCKLTKLVFFHWLQLVFALTFNCSLTITGRAVQDVDPAKRVNELIAEYNSTTESDKRKKLIQSIVLMDVDENRSRHVSELIGQCREHFPVATWARALLIFAKKGGDLDSIQSEMLLALLGADLEAKCDIIEALRYVTKFDDAWDTSLTQIALAGNEADSTYAAVTLLKIQAEHKVATQRLVSHLRSDEIRVAVRAAILCGATGVQNKEVCRELDNLIQAKQFVIRFAAAYAIAMNHPECAKPIEILTDSLTQDDSFIALRREYPSDPGVSHRFFAIRALKELEGKAIGATDELVVLIEIASKEVDSNSLNSQLGFTALETIPSIVGKNQTLAAQLEELIQNTPFKNTYSTGVTNALKRLQ